MRREGADPITSVVFYRAVVQTVLLSGAKTWVLSAAMEKRIVGFHMFFFAASDGETGEEATGWYLAAGREQDRSEGGGDSGCTDIHRQEPSNIDTIVGPLAHI